ncbi:MAG TPA: hypothetical protein VNI01_14895 [Elusimicrobiota bacterium]|jgi:hypothetical protein|nr:hypothetical protein [Elusimicrobiota bacterium]
MSEENPKDGVHEKALQEIAKLGEKLESAVQSAAQNPQVREIHAQVVESVRKIGEQFSKAADAAKTAAESEQGRAVRAQAQKVVDVGKQKGNEAADALRGHLASGLKAVAKELADLGKALEEKR